MSAVVTNTSPLEPLWEIKRHWKAKVTGKLWSAPPRQLRSRVTPTRQSQSRVQAIVEGCGASLLCRLPNQTSFMAAEFRRVLRREWTIVEFTFSLGGLFSSISTELSWAKEPHPETVVGLPYPVRKTPKGNQVSHSWNPDLTYSESLNDSVFLKMSHSHILTYAAHWGYPISFIYLL